MGNKICCCVRNNDMLDDDTAVVGRYEGDKNCFGQKHGYGTFMFRNGDLYVGSWQHNKMHGYGVYTFESGQRKEGFFECGTYIGDTARDCNLSKEEDEPPPLAQTARDDKLEAEQNVKRLERQQKRMEFDKRREESRKRREEFRQKYGNRTTAYGATKRR